MTPEDHELIRKLFDKVIAAMNDGNERILNKLTALGRADNRTDEQVRADTLKAMAQPIDVTLAKSRELLHRTQGKTSLMAQIAREYALARIWHIENGIPLPPFSNGNYDPDKFDVCSHEFPLIEHGLRQLRKAWKEGVR